MELRFFLWNGGTVDALQRVCGVTPRGNLDVYAGFKYFGPNTFGCMHEQRFVVAVDGRSVVGAANCWQEQAPAGWQYYSLQYVDVRKDKRWSGIGTKILQNLDTQPFLQGKVLQLTRTASEEGAKFLEAVLRDGVLGNGYAVIPDDYKPTMPPGGVGVFDGEGGRV